MTDYLEYPDGATPLTVDEFHELIPKYITTQGELNAAEQMNVAQGLLWIGKKKFSLDSILDEKFVRSLHKKLFGNVWKWAGKFRKTDKNIGVDWFSVSVSLNNLLHDVKFSLKKKAIAKKR